MPPLAAGQWQFNDVDRVVAISDIHGAYDAMVQTLQGAAVIDASLAWSGAATHLVIVGDVVDRGPDSRKVLDLLMRLEPQAAAAGGRLHVLLGNHEAMNMSGDVRYVSAAEYAAFADDESVDERERWFELYRTRRAAGDADPESLRAAFDARFPAGFFAHRRAFAAQGYYGRWLLAKPAIIVIDDTAFVHGGLPPMVAELGLQGINETLVSEFATYLRAVQRLIDAELLLPTDDELQYPALLRDAAATAADTDIANAVADVLRLARARLPAPDGPLWYRQNVYCSALIETDRLEQALAAVGAQRVVIGHTPTDGRQVLERFGGRVFEIDTGMLADYYHGSGHALVIEDGQVSVVSQHGAGRLSPMPHPRRVGQQAGSPLSAAELEALLQSGVISVQGPEASGRTRVTVGDANASVAAEFVAGPRAGVYPDVAAYRLDRLLQLELVPVTVRRELAGRTGSLQFVPVHWIDESRRQQSRAGGGADCALKDQWQLMLMFDVLLGKQSRDAASIRYDQPSFQLMLVGNDDAFSTSGSKPARFKDVPLPVGPAWREALAALTDARLEQEFADVLDKRRLRALRQRRDLLLSE